MIQFIDRKVSIAFFIDSRYFHSLLVDFVLQQSRPILNQNNDFTAKSITLLV